MRHRRPRDVRKTIIALWIIAGLVGTVTITAGVVSSSGDPAVEASQESAEPDLGWLDEDLEDLEDLDDLLEEPEETPTPTPKPTNTPSKTPSKPATPRPTPTPARTTPKAAPKPSPKRSTPKPAPKPSTKSPTPKPPPPPNDSVEAQVVELTNQERAGAGCQPVVSDPKLSLAARNHSADMANRGYFDHTNPEGKDPGDRIREAGFSPLTSWAENIAAGQRTAQEVVNAWMNSPDHRENILNCKYTHIGVGLVNGHWTQVFATH